MGHHGRWSAGGTGMEKTTIDTSMVGKLGLRRSTGGWGEAKRASEVLTKFPV